VLADVEVVDMADSQLRNVADEPEPEPEAEQGARSAGPPLTRDDWERLQNLTADLADEDVMRRAWS
jgi:hypothetical protein